MMNPLVRWTWYPLFVTLIALIEAATNYPPFLFAHNGIAYTAGTDSHDLLRVYDMGSTGAVVAFLRSIPFPGPRGKMALAGKYGYFCTAHGSPTGSYTRLHVVDVSLAIQPKPIGTGVEKIVASQAVVVLMQNDEATYLFTGAEMYKVSRERPGDPVWVARVEEIVKAVDEGKEDVQDVVVVRNMAFVTLGLRLWAVNVADPSNPQVAHHEATPSEHDNVDVGVFGRMGFFGGWLYVADWVRSRVHIFDVRNEGSSPRFVTSRGVPGQVCDIAISAQGRAVVTGHDHQFTVLDLHEDVMKTIQSESGLSAVPAVTLDKSNGYIVVATSPGYFMSFQPEIASIADSPPLRTSPLHLEATLYRGCNTLATRGNLVFAARGSGLTLLKIASGFQVLKVIEFNPTKKYWPANHIKLYEDYVYVLNAMDVKENGTEIVYYNLVIIHVSDQSELRVVGEMTIPHLAGTISSIRRMAIIQHFLYVGPFVYDLADPSKPRSVGIFERRNGRLQSEGDTLYEVGKSLVMFNLSNPVEPKAAESTLSTDFCSFEMQDGIGIRVQLTTEDSFQPRTEHLQVYNVSDPLAPQELSTSPLILASRKEAIPYRVYLQGYLALLLGLQTFLLVDIGDPTTPVVLDRLIVPDQHTVALSDIDWKEDRVLVAARDRVLLLHLNVPRSSPISAAPSVGSTLSPDMQLPSKQVQLDTNKEGGDAFIVVGAVVTAGVLVLLGAVLVVLRSQQNAYRTGVTSGG